MQVESVGNSAQPTSVAQADPGGKGSHAEWLILFLLIGCMIAQMWVSAARLSITSDEADHLHAGYRYLQCKDFGWNPEHPPLVKMVAALPLLWMHVKDPAPEACGHANTKRIDFVLGHDFVFANPRSMLMAARHIVSLFALALLTCVFLFARQMFGLRVAAISAIIIAFEPNLIGNGALITTDVPAALGFLIAVFALYGYVRKPSPARVVVTGLAIGFALTLKHSTLMLFPLAALLLAGDVLLRDARERHQSAIRHFTAFWIIVLIAVSVLWGVYGFRYAARPNQAEPWITPRLLYAQGKLPRVIIPQLEEARFLPQSYLIGLQDIAVESDTGRTSFVLGHVYSTGRWWYFPVAAVIKFTIPFLLLTVLSFLAVGFWRQHLRELVFMLVPAAFIFAVSMSSGLNMGIRHVLPVVPFLAIFGVAGVWNLAAKNRVRTLALCLLVAYHGVTSLLSFPNYLSYANEAWGGPANLYKYLADSNADWGQALKMAHDYLVKNRPGDCWILNPYNEFNTDYDIPCHEISSFQRGVPPRIFSGTIIASASVVDGIVNHTGGSKAVKMFAGRTPVTKLGGSALLVLDGTFDMTPVVVAQLFQQALETSRENPQLAITEAERILAMEPNHGRTHALLCQGYGMLGDLETAERECNVGLELLRRDADINPSEVRSLANLMRMQHLRIYSEAPH